jgi:hypothetical protein
MPVTIHIYFILFLYFSITINIKIFLFFHFLYHINNFFITIQIKKNYYNTNFFHFFIQIHFLLYHIITFY